MKRSVLPFIKSLSLRQRIGPWLACLLLALLASNLCAQDLIDQKQLTKHQRKIESFQGQYRRTARRQPDNEGAKILAERLDELATNLKAYSDQQSSKKAALQSLENAVKECGRYDTPQARKTLDVLQELHNFLKSQPDLAYLDEKPVQLSEPPAAGTSSTTATTGAAAANAGVAINRSAAEKHPEAESEAAADSVATTQDDAKTQDDSLTWDVVLLWIIVFSLAAVVALLFRNFSRMRAEQEARFKKLEKDLMSLDFKQAGQGAASGSGDYLEVVRKDFNKKMDLMEKNAAEFFQALETRLDQMERAWPAVESGGKSPSSVEAPDFVIQDFERRIKLLEQEAGRKQPTGQTFIQLEKLPDQQQMDALYEALKQLKKQSNLKLLSDNAQWLIDQLKRAEHQSRAELIDLHLAGTVLQLAHVASYNEQLDEPFSALLRSFVPLGLVPDSCKAGENCLPADSSVNVPLPQYREEERFGSAELPDRPTVLRQIEKNFPKDGQQAGQVLNVLRPTLWFEQGAGRVLLSKGMYVIG